MDPDVIENLERYTLSRKISKSDFIRDAINLRFNLLTNQEVDPETDLCMFSYNVLRVCFDRLTDEDILQMAEVARENTQKIRSKSMANLNLPLDAKMPISTALNLLFDRLYGPTGFRWLTEYSVKEEKGSFFISATHLLGQNFSKFLELNFRKYLAYFNLVYSSTPYEIEEETYSIQKCKDKSPNFKISLKLSPSNRV